MSFFYLCIGIFRTLFAFDIGIFSLRSTLLPPPAYYIPISNIFSNYIPLSATLFLLTLSRASSGIVVTPFLKKGVTFTSSHSIGTFAAEKMRLTETEISGPIPSPRVS
jgi:hypothetical protein